MKISNISFLIFAFFFAAAGSAHAQSSAAAATSEMSMDDMKPATELDLHPRLVPQIAMSSLQYTGKDGAKPGQAVSGGLTAELGSTKQRLLETGFLVLRTSGNAVLDGKPQTLNTTQLAIPMNAKIRVIDLKSQSWYLKIGVTTAFQIATNNSATNAFDVLGGAGIGVRLPLAQRADLLVEATYNHGFLNAVQGITTDHDGILGFTGLSFAL